MLSPRAVRATLVGVVALIVVHAAISGCDHDEIEHLHAAWLVAHGQRPFVDFLEQHHPVIWYLLAPIARAFEERPRGFVFAARCLDLGLVGVTIACFTAMSRRLLRDHDVAWPALLLAGSFLFLRDSIEVRPDPWMAALAAIAMWQWTAFLRGGSLASAAWAGIALGGSIAFLQKAIVLAGFLALGTAVVLGRDWRRWIRTASGGGILLLGAALPVAALAIYEERAGTFREFWFWNYTFNAFYYLETRFPKPSAWATLATAAVEEPLLWVAGLVGLASALRRPSRADPEIVLSGAVVCGILAGLFRSRWPYSHNLLLLTPSLSLLAVRPIETALSSPRMRVAVISLFALLLFKVAVLAFFYDENPGAYAMQRALLSSTSKTDRVSVPPPYHPIFRRDAFFFWYVPEYNVAAYLDCCREYACPAGKVLQDLRAWKVQPPLFVYSPPQDPSWTASGFREWQSEYRRVDVGLWKRSPPGPAAGNP